MASFVVVRTRRLTTMLERAPRWLRLCMAIVAVVVGVALVTRPTTSLGVLAVLLGIGMVVLGVVTLVGEIRDAGGALRVASGALMILTGLFLLAFLGLTVRLTAVVVGIALIAHGALQVAEAIRPRDSADARVASALLGTSGVVFGVLALLWPDITLLVVAVVFGARLVMLGLVHGWAAWRGEPSRTEEVKQVTAATPRRWLRTLTAVGALVLAVVAGAGSAYLRGGSPVIDDFYAAPRDVPAGPGHLIRAEAFTREVPENGRAWRILYTTTRGDGSPAVASALVVVPTDGDGDWPVIQWAHGTTGYAQQCAPSLLAEPFTSGALFLLPQILEQGWALVATDYIGLGTEGPHPYLIGADSAHAVLDAARAARELEEADLGERSVVWGHSQGGGAALWSGALAVLYAPDLEIDGVAALAPAANLPALVAALPDITGGSVFASFVISAYAAVYPDVTWREYVRPGAQVTVEAIASHCLSEPGVLVSVLHVLSLSRDPVITSQDPSTGPLGDRLAENVPPVTTAAPLLLAQGTADGLITPEVQEPYVDAACEAGQQLDYRSYAGLDHVGLVEADSPLAADLVAWTKDRFSGLPVDPGCTRSER